MRVSPVLFLPILFACQQATQDEYMSAPPPPAAAILAPVRESMPLDARLDLLEQELDAILAHRGVNDDVTLRIYRAEAITDRILETSPPFTWLATGYDVQAKLRQIQALADRVVAQVRRSEPDEGIFADLARLRGQVADLRAALRTPGGEPPPSLEVLLAGVESDSVTMIVTEGATGE